MKTLRFFTIVLVAVLLFSTWVPVYAKPGNTSSTNSVELAKTNLARLRVTNKTGGSLRISMSSKDRSYTFSTAKQGKVTFDAVIQPGKYNITVTSSGCGGELHYKMNVKGGTVGLPPFICR